MLVGTNLQHLPLGGAGGNDNLEIDLLFSVTLWQSGPLVEGLCHLTGPIDSVAPLLDAQ